MRQLIFAPGFGLMFFALSAARIFANGDLPERADFSRYETMLERSSFAVAAPRSRPQNDVRDLYVASVAGDIVTLASTTDGNFKLQLKQNETIDGFRISKIQSCRPEKKP